jgi:hypothetical protein
MEFCFTKVTVTKDRRRALEAYPEGWLHKFVKSCVWYMPKPLEETVNPDNEKLARMLAVVKEDINLFSLRVCIEATE